MLSSRFADPFNVVRMPCIQIKACQCWLVKDSFLVEDQQSPLYCKPSGSTTPTRLSQVAPGVLSPYVPKLATDSVHVRTATMIALDDVVSTSAPPRKVKIICTLGPSCWSEQGLAGLIDAGMGIARSVLSLNLSPAQ